MDVAKRVELLSGCQDGLKGIDHKILMIFSISSISMGGKPFENIG